MRYRFYTCDVFTDTRFGGNQLAVLPDASGLSGARMQQIAREFNYSESTFVTPGDTVLRRKVRIFTPSVEVPFAGHPNIGTAFVLASVGEFGPFESSLEVVFEERAGAVPIAVQRVEDGAIRCELEAPERISLGQEVPVAALAAAVSLAPGDLVTDTHPPRVASVGLPFVVAELRDRACLERARIDPGALAELPALGVTPDVHLYVRSGDDFDIRARMFAPLDGVPEDPATGSANCALAGLLAHHAPAEDASYAWRIAQGVEMGRPSVLEARARKEGAQVTATWIGGASVMVSEGFIEVD